MARSDIFDIIFREKPAMMLVALLNVSGDIHASALAKITDCTNAHVLNVLEVMDKAGLVTCEKQGRLKRLTLTDKGRIVACSIDNVRNALSRI